MVRKWSTVPTSLSFTTPKMHKARAAWHVGLSDCWSVGCPLRRSFEDTRVADYTTLASRTCFCPNTYDGEANYAELPDEDAKCVDVEDFYTVNELCVPAIKETADCYLMKRENPFAACVDMDAGCDGLYIRHYDVESLQYVCFPPLTPDDSGRALTPLCLPPPRVARGGSIG